MSGGIRQSVQKLHPYVPGEQPRGGDVLKLNTNENPYPPSPKVFEAMASVDADALRKYPHPTGAPLCQAIAELHGLAPEQVLVSNGSDEILALCTRAFLEDDGVIGYMEPSYSLYPILCDIADVHHKGYPLHADFSWTIPEEIDADFFFLTRPNAPSSLSLPLDEVRRLAGRVHGVLLVDEAYADFAEDDAVGLLAECDNLLISRTLSKSYSLAGIRMGYVLGSATLVEALYKIKDSYNTDVLAQRIAEAAIRDQDWMQTNAKAVCGTRARVTKELETRGYDVLPSQTNFVFAKPGQGGAAEIFAGLKAENVYIRYFPGELTGEYLRITIGTDQEMDRFFAVLDGL